MTTKLNDDEMYFALEVRLAEGDLEGALEILDDFCRRHENRVGLWEMRGLLEAKARRPNLSIHYLERANALGTLETWSLRTLATQYASIGQSESAVDVLHELGLSGRLGTPMLRLVSHDLLSMSRPELSAEIVWTAIRSAPRDPVLWHELSAIQSVLGESPESCFEAVERAIQLAPGAIEFRVTAATLLIRMDQTSAAALDWC